ncbi:MAG: hypothetical protein II822_12010 [Prevotella sp.]|nr:hypothetical protein [Prevotella sp.]
MKRRNNKLLGLLLPLAAAAALAGCSADEAETTQPQTWQVSIPTATDTDMTRTTLSVSGTTMSAAWKTTDAVQVYKSGSSVGTVTPSAAAASAVLRGTLSGTYAVNNELTLYWPDNSPNYTVQDGTLDGTNGISKKDWIQATVKVTAVDATSGILGTQTATFSHRQSFTKFTFSEAVKTVKISASGMSDITVTASSDQKDFYVALPLEGSVSYTFLCTTAAGVEYRGTKTGNLTHGKYYITDVAVAPGVGVTNTSSWGSNDSWDIGSIYF